MIFYHALSVINFIQVHDVHSYNTRSSTLYNIPAVRTNSMKTSMTFRAPKLWNSLPTVLRQSPSLTSFKFHVKQFFISVQYLPCIMFNTV